MHKAPEAIRRTKGPRYTPVSKRQDKPDGIAWIIRNHPEVSDGQIYKLIGTTRTTIAALGDREALIEALRNERAAAARDAEAAFAAEQAADQPAAVEEQEFIDPFKQ